MSNRKRPVCHTCGSPMAGHKRPNGSPVCPKAAPSSPTSSNKRSLLSRIGSSFAIPEDRHYVNPNYVEPVVYVLDDDDDGGDDDDDEHSEHSSLVPTDVADEEQEAGMSGSSEDDDDVQTTASSSAGSSVSARIKRSLSEMFMVGPPLASLFSTPQDNVPALTQAAQRRGLFMGLIQRRDRSNRRRIKREESDVAVMDEPRRNPRWVVMGQDPQAVEYLLDISEEEIQSQVGAHGAKPRRTGGMVGAYPVDTSSIRMTFLDVLVAGAIGGLVVWYGLSIL